MSSTTTSTAQAKVLIVGAGIGGLALAQILRKQNIAYEIFERDQDRDSRGQGWAIALVECLPDFVEMTIDDLGDIAQTSVNQLTGEADMMALMDTSTGELIKRIGGIRPGQAGGILRVKREDFRNYIWNHTHVAPGKQFDHYEETDSGVTVFFKDGTSTSGTILVGADGASSHVREQLLRGSPTVSKAEHSILIPLMGAVTLPLSTSHEIDTISNAVIVGGSTGGTRIMLSKMGIDPTAQTASYYFAIAYPHPSDPDSESDRISHLTKAQLHALALEKLDPSTPSLLVDAVKATGPEGMYQPPLRFLEFVPPQSLPEGRVTLLGDAAHAMVPFRGAGANTAVRDACDLGRIIARVVENEVEKTEKETTMWTDAVQEYNATMLKRGKEMVLGSRDAGTTMSGLMGLVERKW